MGSALISRKTLIEFREYFVGWTLREIDDEFSAAGIRPVTLTSAFKGERRTRVEEHYASLDLRKPSDVDRLLVVFENALVLARRHSPDNADNLEQWLRKDGFHVDKDARIVAQRVTLAKHLASKIEVTTADALHSAIRRLEGAVESDPALAIGAAKELIESVCKTILDSKGVEYSTTADLSELVKATTKALKLAPEDIPNAAKGAELVKKTLHSLNAVVGYIGELRGLYGTGHGKTGKAKGLQARHARLVAGAATALVTFLWDTFEERH